ncbi:MAG: tetratricopeptide repeat protein [Acidobacteriota bacterium]
MVRFTLSVASALVLVFAPTVLAAQISWVPRLRDALKLAQSQNKFVVIDVSASWCPPCIKMEREVFRDPRFIEFAQSQVLMRVDAENDAEGRSLAARFNVNSYPTVLILSPSGDEIHRLIGGRSTAQLISDLQDVFSDPRSSKQLEEQLRGEGDSYEARYRIGTRLRDRSEHEKAIPHLKKAFELAMTEEQKRDALVALVAAASEAHKSSDCLEAITLLEKSWPEAGSVGALQARKAEALIRLKRHDEANDVIRQLLAAKSSEDKALGRELLSDLPGKYRQQDKELAKKLEDAQKKLRDRQLEAAVAVATSAVADAPSSADAHALVAVAQLHLAGAVADPEQKASLSTSGLDHLRLARRLEPENLYVYAAAKELLASQHVPQRPRDEDCAKTYLNAEKAFAEGRLKDAVDLYRKVITEDPGFGKAYLHMGDCFFRNNQYREALECYRMAAARTPLDPAAHRFGADALLRMGQGPEARRWLVNSLLADPEYPTVWMDLDTVAQSEGKNLERHHDLVPLQLLVLDAHAGADDDRLLEAVPAETASAWRQYLKQKRLWRQEQFRKQFPHEKFYHTSAQEELDCLRALVTEWNRVRDSNPSLRNERLDFIRQLQLDDMLEAFVFLELFTEEYRTAFEKWKKANEVTAHEYIERYLFGAPVAGAAAGQFNTSAVEAYNAGVKAQQEGRMDEAGVFYEKALRQEPNMPQALYNLASVSLARNDFKRAKGLLQQLVRLRPDDADVYSMLAGVSIGEQDYETAAVHAEKALALESNPDRRMEHERRLKELRDFLDQTRRSQSQVVIRSPAPEAAVARPPASRREEAEKPDVPAVTSERAATVQGASEALLAEEPEEAIAILLKILPSIRNQVDRNQATLMLGMAYMQLENWNEAERWLSEYTKSNPNDSHVRDLLKEVRAKQKK